MAVEQQEVSASESEDAAPGRATPVRRRAWVVLALLVCLMLVNYADKVVVGLAGVGMKEELGLDDARFGVIQSSFFWLFAVGSVLGGWLGGKVRARWLLAGIAALWALSLAPMAAQVGFTTIVACRILLGLAEGPTTALAMQVAHSWFPAHKRAVPSSIVVAGAGIGPLIAAPVLTWVILTHSWHTAFAVLAVVGAVIAGLWLIGGDSGPEVASAGHGHGHGTAQGGAVPVLPERIPLRRLFSTGTLIGMALLFFVAYANTSVKVSWLPLYLREGLGYDATAAGNLVALPYLGSAIAVILVGLLSSAMTRRGIGSRMTRGILPGAMVVASGVCTIAFSSLDRGVPQMTLLVLGSCLNSAGYGVAFAGLADVVPAKQRGTVFGIITGIYSLGGVVAPLVMGRLVDSGESVALGYGDGFLVLGVTMIIGAAAALTLVDPARDAAKLAAKS
ncbi:MFS transporter [Streptomyces sp. NBC_00094]|uniref:MFS transporter n=1 Tax=Streptomyces sp. NBC_00094 TaxID=2903620 RepID=UPI0022594AEF|nr:MFS transporter [Streptomyces sp. NBC_00094]MCX5394571.1 MFS transporter [Streptomyces sp. NBC_00094]